jgi:hypothetical protein
LLHLPNLSTLKIPSYTDMPDPLFKPDFISFVFAQALKLQNSNICSAYSLSNLRPFEVSVDQGAELVSFSSILPLLQLKSLRSVTCPLAVADEEPTAYAMEPIRGSPTCHSPNPVFTLCRSPSFSAPSVVSPIFRTSISPNWMSRIYLIRL